jgi:hypothetical protein
MHELAVAGVDAFWFAVLLDVIFVVVLSGLVVVAVNESM